MLHSRSVWCLCLMYGGLGFSGNFFLFFLPDYLKTQRALPPGQAKWLSALPFVFGVFACLAGGVPSSTPPTPRAEIGIRPGRGAATRSEMAGGYTGRALHVNLTDGRHWVEGPGERSIGS